MCKLLLRIFGRTQGQTIVGDILLLNGYYYD